MLIEVTYSASVERRKTQGHIEDQRQALKVVVSAAEAISASTCAKLLDAIGVNHRPTHVRLSEAIAVHLELCEALTVANNRENSSLASKYLHSHRPEFFPILDSFFREGWSWVMDQLGLNYKGWRDLGKVGRYKDWCEHVLQRRDLIEESRCETVSLRQIDNYLLSIMSLDGRGGWGLPRLPS